MADINWRSPLLYEETTIPPHLTIAQYKTLRAANRPRRNLFQRLFHL